MRKLRTILSELFIRNKTKAKKSVHFSFLGQPLEELNAELRMGFYPVTAISQTMNMNDQVPVKNRPGVYKINCGECVVLLFWNGT